MEEEEEAPVPLVTRVDNILHSFFFPMLRCTSSISIFTIESGLYAHKSNFSNKFKVAISEYEGVLHCKGYDYEEFPDDIMEAPL